MKNVSPQKRLHSFIFFVFLLVTSFGIKAQQNETELLKTLIKQLCNDKGFARQLEITEPEQLQKFYFFVTHTKQEKPFTIAFSIRPILAQTITSFTLFSC